MGTTPSGLWYPDTGTPMTPLSTVLSTMQSSVETALAQVRTDLAASWPQISIVSSGATRQQPPNITVTRLTGNSGGWLATTNTGGTFMSVTTGVNGSPINILKTGKYLFGIENHADIVGDTRGFVQIVATGAFTAIKRVGFTGDDTVASSVIMDVTAVPTSVGVEFYMNRSDGANPNISSTNLDVYKMP